MATINATNNTTALLDDTGAFEVVGGVATRHFNAVTAAAVPTVTQEQPAADNTRDLIIATAGEGAVFDDIQITCARVMSDATTAPAAGTQVVTFNNCDIGWLGQDAITTAVNTSTRQPGNFTYNNCNIKISGNSNDDGRWGLGVNRDGDTLTLRDCRFVTDANNSLNLNLAAALRPTALVLERTEFIGAASYIGTVPIAFAGVAWPADGDGSTNGTSATSNRSSYVTLRTNNRAGGVDGLGLGAEVPDANVANVEAGGTEPAANGNGGIITYHEGDDFAAMGVGTGAYCVSSAAAIWLIDCNYWDNAGDLTFVRGQSRAGDFIPTAGRPSETRHLRSANVRPLRDTGDFVNDTRWIAAATDDATAPVYRMVAKHGEWVAGTTTARDVGAFTDAGTLITLTDEDHNGLLIEMERDVFTANPGNDGVEIVIPNPLFVIGRAYSSSNQISQAVDAATAFDNSEGLAQSAEIRSEFFVDEFLNGRTEAQATTLATDGISSLDDMWPVMKSLWANDFNEDQPLTIAGSTLECGGDITFATAAGTSDIDGVDFAVRLPANTTIAQGNTFQSITATGDVTFPEDQTIEIGVDATNIIWTTAAPTDLIDTGNLAVSGTITLPAGDYNIVSGDVTGLTISADTGNVVNVSIAPAATGVPTAAGAGTVNFPFSITFNTDAEGVDVSIFTHPDTGLGTHVHTELNVTGTAFTLTSTDLPAGDYVAMLSSAGRAGTAVEFTVADRTLNVNLTSLNLSLLGYPEDTPLAGRTFTYAYIDYEGRHAIQINQTAGGYDYETQESLRLFGDLWGVELNDRKPLVDAFLESYNEFSQAVTDGNISALEPFGLNADGVTRVRTPIIRFLPTAGLAPAAGYTIFADATEALIVDADYAMFATVNVAALVGGSASATPPGGIQASSLNAAGDSIVARVNANTDAEIVDTNEAIALLDTRVQNVARNI